MWVLLGFPFHGPLFSSFWSPIFLTTLSIPVWFLTLSSHLELSSLQTFSSSSRKTLVEPFFPVAQLFLSRLSGKGGDFGLGVDIEMSWCNESWRRLIYIGFLGLLSYCPAVLLFGLASLAPTALVMFWNRKWCVFLVTWSTVHCSECLPARFLCSSLLDGNSEVTNWLSIFPFSPFLSFLQYVGSVRSALHDVSKFFTNNLCPVLLFSFFFETHVVTVSGFSFI